VCVKQYPWTFQLNENGENYLMYVLKKYETVQVYMLTLFPQI